MTRIGKQELGELARSAFEQVGVPPEEAGAAATIPVGANPAIRVIERSPSVAIVDGDDGLGPVSGHRGQQQRGSRPSPVNPEHWISFLESGCSTAAWKHQSMRCC